MDRVIPKDVVDLIYKESHLDKMKRLNEEYHKLFRLITVKNEVLYYENFSSSGVRNSLNARDLCYQHYLQLWNFKKNCISSNLPKRYFHSSGHFELKWIE